MPRSPLKKATVLGLLHLSVVVLSAKPHRNETSCFPNTSVCSPVLFDKNTGISLSFAIPAGFNTASESDTTMKDFVASVITPEPYGYAGFSGATLQAALSPLERNSVLWWIQNLQNMKIPVTQEVNNSASAVLKPSGKTDESIVVQLSHPSTDGTSFLPVLGDAVVTISPMSFTASTYSSRIFRCQNCSIPGGGGLRNQIPLSVFLNPTTLHTPGQTTLNNVTLPVEEMKNGSIVIDIKSYRTPDYDSLLAILKLV